MHELSVCLALMQQVESIARSREASRVSKVVLDVGPLSGVEPDLLRNAYPLAAAGTVAADAELEIRETGIVVSCTQCEQESEAVPNRLLCAHCGDYRTRVVSGDDLILASVELENAKPLGDTPGPSSQDPAQTLQ